MLLAKKDAAAEEFATMPLPCQFSFLEVLKTNLLLCARIQIKVPANRSEEEPHLLSKRMAVSKEPAATCSAASLHFCIHV